MPFLDLNAQHEKRTKVYVKPLQKFSELLEEDGFENLPEPKDPLPGPIIYVHATLNPRIQGRTIYLYECESSVNEDLKAAFHNVLLRDVFGVQEEDDPGAWGLGEKELREKLWSDPP